MSEFEIASTVTKLVIVVFIFHLYMHRLVADGNGNNGQSLQFRQACGQRLSLGLAEAIYNSSR